MSGDILEAKHKLPLPALLHQLGLGEHAKKSARCPFHEDKNPSFSIWRNGDGCWGWKCHTGCGGGDEITFLERHKGIPRGEAIKLFLEMAGVTTSGQTSQRNLSDGQTALFDWQRCVSTLKPSDLVRLGNERWLSRACCEWFHDENKLIGKFRGDYAFPVQNNGTVVGAHYKVPGDWRYHPPGIKTAPLILGDLSKAKQVHCGESQWDMLALADRTDWYKNESVAFIATRGAGNAALVKGLIPQGVSICAWPQNDQAGEKWLNDLSAFVPGLAVARVPVSIRKANEFGEAVEVRLKDVNDWTKAGASPEAIYGAFWRNELAYGPPRPADLEVVLDEICAFLRRYVVFPFPEQQPVAIALWIAHTWTLDVFDYTPYLHIHSPEKRCGKTRLLDCVELIVSQPWRAISPTEAVLFRKIEADKPTLLLDEVDAVFTGGKDERKEPLRALLNAGFERKTKVPRCVGQSFQVQDFEVFCAKALSGIGRLPDTVNDRCIPISLIRRSHDECVERFRKREAETAVVPIRAALAELAQQRTTIDKLRMARPDIPVELSDRQADICEPLLAIADLVGGEWPERSRGALVKLCGEQDDGESVQGKLLSAIREAFDASGTDKLSTQQLLEALVSHETDAPWAGWWESDLRNGNTRGPAARLARLLKPYSIEPRVIRFADGTTPRGYLREDFEDAWKRYCPPKTP
jgi:hypothetical protein